MQRSLLAVLTALAAVSGCYAHHESDEIPAGSSDIEIGTGCGGFEMLPARGGTVELRRHVRGGWGLCAPIRIRGFAEGGEIRGEARDPATGAIVAEPRGDELHRVVEMDGDWAVTGPSMLLFMGDPDVSELYGLPLILRATAPAADGRMLVDEREVVVATPSAELCEAWQTEVEAEYAAIRACTSASECGQDIPLGCGCTRNPVARLDADVDVLFELLASWPLQADGTPCPEPDIPLGSTCDCPPADGYRCEGGACEWNLS